MTPTEAANAVKVKLLEAIEAMNDAADLGVKIEFNVGTDPHSGKSALAHFGAWQKMKVEQ
jgi:hypothetical protein